MYVCMYIILYVCISIVKLCLNFNELIMMIENVLSSQNPMIIMALMITMQILISIFSLIVQLEIILLHSQIYIYIIYIYIYIYIYICIIYLLYSSI